MDDRALDEATRQWVESGLIDESTAAAIREYEAERETDSTRRFTTYLAAMGAGLVGAGVLAFLAANWQELGPWIRTAILIVIPLGFGVGGLVLDRREAPRAGMGTWILASIIVGPSILLLADIHAPGIDPVWPLLGWGFIALAMGHAFGTRLSTAVGLLALLAAVFVSGDGQLGLFLAGIMGTVVLGMTVPLRERAPELVETYRVIGVGIVIVGFLWVNTVEGEFARIALEVGAGFWGAILVAMGVSAVVLVRWHQGAISRSETMLVPIPLLAVSILVGTILLGETLPAILGYLLVQALFLAVLVAVVLLALLLGSPMLVNVVTVGFFLQILTLLSTIMGELTGALALVVTGLALVLVAIGLERGRRRLFDRLQHAP